MTMPTHKTNNLFATQNPLKWKCFICECSNKLEFSEWEGLQKILELQAKYHIITSKYITQYSVLIGNSNSNRDKSLRACMCVFLICLRFHS
jgi:hypothetical protein